MLELLYERSEGNAFLIEEILGALQAGAGRRGPAADAARRAAGARRAAVGADAVGCCGSPRRPGARCPDRLLAAVAGLDEASLDAALREAVEHHLLVIDETGQRLRFRHALTRDAIYSDTLPRERVRIHAAYAAGAVRGSGARRRRRARSPPRSRCTGRPPTTSRARWPPASRRRGWPRRYAPAEALRHFEQALELWPSVPDAAERCGMDVVEVLRLAGLQRVRGRRRRARAGAVRRGARASSSPPATASGSRCVLEGRAQALGCSGAPTRRSRRSSAPCRCSPRSRRPSPAPSCSPRSPGSGLMFAGDFDGVQGGRRGGAAGGAARRARASRRPNARIMLGVALCYLGEHEAGIASLQTGRELAEAIGADATAVRAHLNLSDSLEVLGSHAEAADGRRARPAARRAGRPRAAHLRQAPDHQPGRGARPPRPLDGGRAAARQALDDAGPETFGACCGSSARRIAALRRAL